MKTDSRVVQRYFRLMGVLEKEYSKSKPQYGEQGFKQRVYGRIKNLLKENPQSAFLPNGNINAATIVELIVDEGAVIESDVAWSYIACANAVAAMWAMDEKDEERAWDLLCEASFYLGTILVTNRGEEIFTKAVVDVYKSAIASEGGSKSHGKTNALKAWVYEFVRSQAPWDSQSKAILGAEIALKEKFGPNCLKNFEDTIKGWIRDMPDRLALIPSLGARLK